MKSPIYTGFVPLLDQLCSTRVVQPHINNSRPQAMIAIQITMDITAVTP